MSVLVTQNLVKRFGGLTATDHVSLTVEAGEIHALIGPNGAGKTTLITQLVGELTPDEGSVSLNGEDVTALPVHARSRRGLARSYQITQVCKEFTALENVMLAAQSMRPNNLFFFRNAHSESAIVDAAHDALKQVGLASRAAVNAAVMAHGEHRQLELAMALALKPKLLLLDEPLAGMSQGESESMIALLQQLRGKIPMLLVEHDMDAVFALADRVSVLVYGKIIATDTPDRIRENADVKSAYLGH
jgi:branched-chain amino acid transport system ATP-binding protein